MGAYTIYKSKQGQVEIQDSYEEYLKSFLVEVERVYVKTRFGNTHVLVTGPEDGKPVFVFQGGNCINPMTLAWFTSLFSSYRVYAPDTIGHPGFSDEKRISGQDDSFAHWISDLMEHFTIKKSAFIGPSYGGGIILRLAAHMPEKIACAVMVSPAGIALGSKLTMIRKILFPLMFFNLNSGEKHLSKITNRMSLNSMKEIDQRIIGSVFKHVKLEQDMPKLTRKEELKNYAAPTLVISGKQDVFFPENKLADKTHKIISNLVDFKSYEMGHFPSQEHLVNINEDIIAFLNEHY